ncbi:hypothetical protein GCM10025876_05010 [Demequina litorisediminis]|uniref:Glutamate-1-semialdehyde 2,1-aminomutase n=1 Tax=Demequina litorisediminis TaxID=1849022 RepID=A0ABQ6IBD5_9MICO|nr:hypothetical protein GCM10025876_05010 [Demequina litorisediminis]
MYQAGTLSGNPVAVAAGLATMRVLTDDVYTHLGALADRLIGGVSAAFGEAGVTHAVGRAGTLFSYFLGLADAPVTFEQAAAQDTGAFAGFFHAMHDAGVYLPPARSRRGSCRTSTPRRTSTRSSPRHRPGRSAPDALTPGSLGVTECPVSEESAHSVTRSAPLPGLTSRRPPP